MNDPAGASPRPAAIGNEERLARLRLAFSDNVGPSTWHHLIGHFGSAQAAIEGLPELASRAGAGRRVRLYPLDKALRDIEQTAQCGGTLLSYGDEGYPILLAEAGHAPPVLFARGRVEMLNEPCCAIVGSRNASGNGRRFARELAMTLGRSGWAVASGLARGIDTAAHQAALESGTIAVMATGLDVVYPAENEGLTDRIAGTGCLVTEMPPGTQPRAELFPRRNRIIAGLSSGVAVIEAALRSGSLITAGLANELGRDVFAMPGSTYDPRSSGTNRLIQDGATLLGSADEIAGLLPQHRSGGRGMSEPLTSIQPPSATIDRSGAMAADERDGVLNLLGPGPG